MASSQFLYLGLALATLGVLSLIMLIIGYFFGDYKKSCDGIIAVTIKFHFPLWAKVCMFGYTPKLERLKALIDYKFEGENRWTFAEYGKWLDTDMYEITVEGNEARRLEVVRWEAGRMMPLDKNNVRPLIGKFTLRIRLFTKGDKLIATF